VAKPNYSYEKRQRELEKKKKKEEKAARKAAGLPPEAEESTEGSDQAQGPASSEHPTDNGTPAAA
jgi:hypothetical protein